MFTFILGAASCWAVMRFGDKLLKIGKKTARDIERKLDEAGKEDE